MQEWTTKRVLFASALFFMSCTPLADSTAEHGDGSFIDPITIDGVLDAGLDGGGGFGGSQMGGPVETGLGTACLQESAQRCSLAGASERQVCLNGVWSIAAPCEAGQICQGSEGAIACRTVAEVCKGSAGTSVCDNQGNLIVCNADGSVSSQQSCESLRLCQLGLASNKCAVCVPNTEFRCSGALLEVCAPDGQSFVQKEPCATEALCNKVAGTCTSGVCAPNKVACSDNTLTKCNADGTAFESQTPCGTATCDEVGGDCNVCEPGHKKCENDMVLTCEPSGQSYMPTACPRGSRCVGAGQCAACAQDADCSAMTQGCKVGTCSTSNTCVAQNAANGTACTASNGKPGSCSAGTCQCTPQCTGKQCGDDGCGGQCPSRCSFAQSCSMNRCVDCTTNSDCSALTRDCQTGSCSAAGTCTTAPRSSGTCTTSSGVTGTCSAGICMCTPNCGLRCGGSNGCGGTCPNTCDPVTQICNLASERCNEKPFITCPANRCPTGMLCAPLGYCAYPCNSGACGSLNGQPRVCVGVLCVLAPNCPAGLQTTTVTDTSGAPVAVCGI